MIGAGGSTKRGSWGHARWIPLLAVVGGLAGCGGADDPGAASPVAAIAASALAGTPPLVVSFDGAGSTATPGEAIASWDWDFGDGGSAEGPAASHTFQGEGQYLVRLTVTDTAGLVGEAGALVSVRSSAGAAPVAAIAASAYRGVESLTVTLDASASRDPDGTIASYRWDFGDGGFSAAPSVAHAFGPGVHDVVLTVTDDSGATGQDRTAIAVASFDDEVVRLTNAERWSYASGSLPPLRRESHLDAAALRHSTDMAAHMLGTTISHTGTDGSTFDQRIREAGYTGYSSLGENIAAGYGTPAAVVAGWMASSGHRANILSTSIREIGVSHVYTAGGYYHHFWTQDFGARTNLYPVVIEREAFSTTSATVSLWIHGSGWAEQMQVSADPGFSGASWETFSSSRTWDLGSGPGTKTVHVRLRRGATEVVSQDSIALVEG